MKTLWQWEQDLEFRDGCEQRHDYRADRIAIGVLLAVLTIGIVAGVIAGCWAWS